MNVPPICEHVTWQNNDEKCDLRAEWEVLDKTTGKKVFRCDAHLHSALTYGHSHTITPARSLAKKDGVGLTLGEARRANVCRICGDRAEVTRREDGTTDPFILGHGYEFAHEDCLGEEGMKALRKLLSTKGPFRGD